MKDGRERGANREGVGGEPGCSTEAVPSREPTARVLTRAPAPEERALL